MVEGGARVIQSFIEHPEMIHRVIVTIAPVFVGEAGVGYGLGNKVGRRPGKHTKVIQFISLQLSPTRTESTAMLGRDYVSALSFVKENVQKGH
jgi:hypothetical protein